MSDARPFLQLDIFNYANEKLCSVYDSENDMSGQAYDVVIQSERNGWRELSFNLPDKIYNEDGEEENFRLQYLVADFRIRAIDDTSTEWYIISEQKITHNAFTKSYSITAGHCCQLLKLKKLDLEFSDDEGNNTGTIEELAHTIIDGTGWEIGTVYDFKEKDGETTKVRSLKASTKTGAFKMMTSLCDLFDAKAIYNSEVFTLIESEPEDFSTKYYNYYTKDTGGHRVRYVPLVRACTFSTDTYYSKHKTVDLLPMNPFSEEIKDTTYSWEDASDDILRATLSAAANLKNSGGNIAVNTDTVYTAQSTATEGSDTWNWMQQAGGYFYYEAGIAPIVPGQAYVMSFDYVLVNATSDCGVGIGCRKNGANHYNDDFWEERATFLEYGGSYTSGHFEYTLEAKTFTDTRYFAFRPLRRASYGTLETPIQITISNFKLVKAPNSPMVEGRNIARNTGTVYTKSSTAERGSDTWLSMQNAGGYFDSSSTIEPIIPGCKYTLSFDYVLENATDDCGVGIGSRMSNSTVYDVDLWEAQAPYITYGGSITSGHFVYNLAPKSFSDTRYFAFRPLRRTSTETLTTPINVTISNFKLEVGSKDTDYTPAPENVDSNFSSYNAISDGKITVFTDSSTPSTSGTAYGDLWIDTTNSNVIKRWNGSEWQSEWNDMIWAAIDADLSGQTKSTAMAAAVKQLIDTSRYKKTILYASSAPQSGSVNDLWFDTSTAPVEICKLVANETTTSMPVESEDVVELHYGKNVSNVTRSLNTEDIVTKLYAYGSYGDDTNGYCSIGECTHKRYTFYNDDYFTTIFPPSVSEVTTKTYSITLSKVYDVYYGEKKLTQVSSSSSLSEGKWYFNESTKRISVSYKFDGTTELYIFRDDSNVEKTYCFTVIDDDGYPIQYQFTISDTQMRDVFTWSDKDPFSKSYIWSCKNGKAYRVEEKTDSSAERLYEYRHWYNKEFRDYLEVTEDIESNSVLEFEKGGLKYIATPTMSKLYNATTKKLYFDRYRYLENTSSNYSLRQLNDEYVSVKKSAINYYTNVPSAGRESIAIYYPFPSALCYPSKLYVDNILCEEVDDLNTAIEEEGKWYYSIETSDIWMKGSQFDGVKVAKIISTIYDEWTVYDLKLRTVGSDCAKYFVRKVIPESGSSYSVNMGLNHLADVDVVSIGGTALTKKSSQSSVTANGEYSYTDSTGVLYVKYAFDGSTEMKINYHQCFEYEEFSNMSDFLFDFSYYMTTGLMSEDQFQDAASYQVNYPEKYNLSLLNSTKFSENLTDLREVIGTNNYCKLSVSSITGNNTERHLELSPNSTYDGDGIIYHTQYNEKRKNKFKWRVVTEYLANGDPKEDYASIVYIVHKGSEIPVQVQKVWLKSVNNTYVNEDIDYDAKYERISLWSMEDWIDKEGNPVEISTDDLFYLFSSNSVSGNLGAIESLDESAEEGLASATKVSTVEHPTEYTCEDPPTEAQTLEDGAYGWWWKYDRLQALNTTNNETTSQLYFVWKGKSDNVYKRVYFYLNDKTNKQPEDTTNGVYWYSWMEGALYVAENGAFVKLDGDDDVKVTKYFGSVIIYCLTRDKYRIGRYKEYNATIGSTNVPYGNYYFKNLFGTYHLFSKAKKDGDPESLFVTGDILKFDTTDLYVTKNGSEDDVYKVESKSFNSVNYYKENVMEDVKFTKVTDEDAAANTYQSEYFRMYSGTNYTFTISSEVTLGTGSYITMNTSKYTELEKKYIADLPPFNSATNTYYGRVTLILASAPTDESTLINKCTLHATNYLTSIMVDENEYKLFPYDFVGGDELLSTIHLTDKFYQLSDLVYGEYLQNMLSAQETMDTMNQELSNSLEDIYREGYWQDDDYVDGDETRLYDDALENLEEIAKPKATYNITYHYLKDQPFEDGLSDETIAIKWPDISTSMAAHLIDQSIDINVWAFIDKIQKCYDKPWETSITINTNLKTLTQHSFSDVMSNIASVASEVKGNITKYDAATSSNKSYNAEKLEGTISANQIKFDGGKSSWYTDEDGNMIFESADKTSAMKLTGYGMCVSNSKNDYGEWRWRNFWTGDGGVADEITVGTLSSDRIAAGSITADKIAANVGEKLILESTNAINNIVSKSDLSAHFDFGVSEDNTPYMDIYATKKSSADVKFKTRITDSEMLFYWNNKIVAQYTQDGIITEKADINSSLQIGRLNIESLTSGGVGFAWSN